MTREEFQERYHDFEAPTAELALAVARKVAIEGEVAFAVGIPFGIHVRWCLMLSRAAISLQAIQPGAFEVRDPRAE